MVTNDIRFYQNQSQMKNKDCDIRESGYMMFSSILHVIKQKSFTRNKKIVLNFLMYLEMLKCTSDTYY